MGFWSFCNERACRKKMIPCEQRHAVKKQEAGGGLGLTVGLGPDVGLCTLLAVPN